MIIKETTIPDIIPTNIDQSKQVLANNIISNVYPLFDEVYNNKVEETSTLKNTLNEKKDRIQEQKKSLENMISVYNKNKKVAKLLDRIEKLISSGLVYDGALKHETVILLKIITKLSEEKVDYHLKATLHTINKRFSR